MPPRFSSWPSIRRSASLFALGAVALAGAGSAASCASTGHTGVPTFQADDSGEPLPPVNDAAGFSVAPGSVVTGNAQCTVAHPCDDFPSTPVLDSAGMPSESAASLVALFGSADAGTTAGGPCLVEPADGALYPNNWLRPRVYWLPTSASQTVFEVRVHSDVETNDLVVYTTNDYYALSESLWETIAKGSPNDAGLLSTGHLVGTSLAFTVRAEGTGGGPPTLSSAATIDIAPAIAAGALVYWATADFDNSATNTTLQGFHVGDEGTSTALTSMQVAQPVRATPISGADLSTQFQQVYCIGCHTASPDGDYVAFNAQWPWPIALASIQATNAGAQPPWLANGAIQNLSPDLNGLYNTYYAPPAVNQIMLGMSTFSPAHYTTGDRMLVSAIGASWNSTSLTDPGAATGVVSDLAWFNLEWNDATTADGGVVATGLPVATPCTLPSPAPNPSQPCIAAPSSTNGGWGSSNARATRTAPAPRAGVTTSMAKRTSSHTRRRTSGPRTGGWTVRPRPAARPTSSSFPTEEAPPARGEREASPRVCRGPRTPGTTSTTQPGRPTTSSSRSIACP